MIPTILIDHDPESIKRLSTYLNNYCPQINICGVAVSCEKAYQLLEELSPSLALLEIEMPRINGFQFLSNSPNSNYETIFTSKFSKFAVNAFKYQVSGFILKPIQIEDLVFAVNKAQSCIETKRKQLENQKMFTQTPIHTPPGNLIGIPNMEGFDFIPVNEIIRCEGLQNCTRIITKDKTDIVSSYSIGTFIKRFEEYGFFSTHKSHLINIIHIKKYYKEGSILMSDNSFVPVAKRRKSLFLKRMLLSR